MRQDAVFADLNGASVLITGGGSGIGAGLVAGFCDQGAKVAFFDLFETEAFCDELEARSGNRPLGLVCDVTDTSKLRACVKEAAEQNGPIRILVSNAANDNRQALLDYSVEDWDAAMAVNLRHYLFAAQAVIPGMQAQGDGAIINMSSISYMMGLPGLAAYTAANGAITALTRSIAREFGGDGIRANAVAPGMIVTERQLEKWLTPESMANHLERQSLPKHLTPEDLIGPVLFLASKASAMVTGQCLIVDGGVVGTG